LDLGVCARPCIGSGNGEPADCPRGAACRQFLDGPLDGVSLCLAATVLDAATPGYPFDLLPGESCADGGGCQSGACDAETLLCVRACQADRDCGGNEICWAEHDEGGRMTGRNLCTAKTAVGPLPDGSDCHDSIACDSGLCLGFCLGGYGDPCNSNADCFTGECSGTCRNHCRSAADCYSVESCNPWPTRLGDDPGAYVKSCDGRLYFGTAPDASACDAHAECASDWCVGGICTTPCAIDDDCTGALATRHCQPRIFTAATFAFCQ
jgi:hypothetical protein